MRHHKNSTLYGQAEFPRQDIAASPDAGNNVNDLNLEGATFVRINSGPVAPFNLTGIAGGADGRRALIFNDSGQAMTIANQSSASNAVNRINAGSTNYVAQFASIAEFIYDTSSSQWLLI